MGVRVREMNPEMRIAVAMLTENSRRSLPTMPPMKSTGMNTTTREIVMERIVKPISLEPRSDAVRASSPCSMRRMIFSSMTIASSTTKPTDRTKAMRDRLLRL